MRPNPRTPRTNPRTPRTPGRSAGVFSCHAGPARRASRKLLERIVEFVKLAGGEKRICEYNQEACRVTAFDGKKSLIRSFPSKVGVRTVATRIGRIRVDTRASERARERNATPPDHVWLPTTLAASCDTTSLAPNRCAWALSVSKKRDPSSFTAAMIQGPSSRTTHA